MNRRDEIYYQENIEQHVFQDEVEEDAAEIAQEEE